MGAYILRGEIRCTCGSPAPDAEVFAYLVPPRDLDYPLHARSQP
jgi:hypothetical protein